MKTTVSSVLALALLGWSATTLAAPIRVDDVATKIVRFKDLDLSTAVGAETLYERIVAAARIVCHGALSTEVRDCRARAVEEAVSAVGSPLLSSVHRSTAGRVAEVALR